VEGKTMQFLTDSYSTSKTPLLLEQGMLLDRVAEQLKAGQVSGALGELIEELAGHRADAGSEWPKLARWYAGHPVRDLLLTDPFTYRAYTKPRGYAGDAVMMDYIYGLGDAESAMRGATTLGRAIFQYLGAQTTPRAVRYRRTLLAQLLDETARREDARVLAIAAGHLREVDLSRAAQERRFAEYVAVDQDAASLSVVARDYGHLGIQALPGSVRQILAGKVKLGQYDFVYAAGLFDYLGAAVGRGFTRRMFDLTRPGGTMLIPNFLTGIKDSGYMEAFMDWHLIYRDHSQMYDLMADVPADQVSSIEVFDDPDRAIAFLLVRKAGTPLVN
jgi:hypothetical protein